jgi:hypothetical protein
MEGKSCAFSVVSHVVLVEVSIYRLHSLIPTFMKRNNIFISVSNVEANNDDDASSEVF